MPLPTFDNLAPEKRQRLMAAALGEFAAHSYREASLDRVAAAASIAKGSLYQYFAGKADLYRYLVLHELGDRKRAALGAALDDDADFAERLERSCLAGLALFATDVQAASLASRLLADASDPDVRSLHDAVREAGVAHARSELVRARSRGELRADVDLEIAARLVAHTTGAALVDVLLMGLGGSIDRLARGATSVDEAVIRATVRQVVAFVRNGLVREPSEGEP